MIYVTVVRVHNNLGSLKLNQRHEDVTYSIDETVVLRYPHESKIIRPSILVILYLTTSGELGKNPVTVSVKW